MTVYIEDVNDNVPKFLDTPYHVTVDELTPTGTMRGRWKDVKYLVFEWLVCVRVDYEIQGDRF